MNNPNQKKYDYLLEQNEKYMDLIALSTHDREITYEEMHESIQKYARLLYKKGVREGDIIGVCALNVPESVYLLYALDIIGAVVVGFSPLDNKEKIKKDIELTRPKMIITVDMKYKDFKSNEKALNFSTMSYSIADSLPDAKLRASYKALQLLKGNTPLSKDRNLLKQIREELSDVKVTPSQYIEDQLTDIMFTGGSTGIHKGVDLAGNGLNSVIEGMKYMYPENFFTGQTYLGNIPLGHMVYGRVIMHIALTNNMNYALTLKALPKDFYGELLRTNAFAAVGGPPHWASLVEKQGDIYVPRKDIKPGSLSNLHLATSGGEAKKKVIEDAVNDALKYAGSQVPLGDGLGATELWSVITLSSGFKYKPYAIGSPISTIETKLVNPETGEVVKKGEHGVLNIAGPSVMIGYHNNPEETNKVISYDETGKKWCSTGDILRELEDGSFEYVGRIKRNFVSGIENIYPEQLEDLISTLPEVREAVVTSIPDELVQFLPKYHISLNDENIDYKEFETKLYAIIEKRLGENWLPCSIEYTADPLKRMANSKLDISYYQNKDNKEYEEGKINSEEARKIRIKKM